MPNVAGKRICLCFFKAMPTTGITGASAIGHRLFQFGSFTCRFDDADPDDCSADDDDIEDDIKEGERERNRQKFVTYAALPPMITTPHPPKITNTKCSSFQFPGFVGSCHG
ncbi:unnamed protein product [Bathycoccus prasinos]